MTDTAIEWTDTTWNPVRGCARVSPGCEHCYAERQAHRFSGKGGPYEGLTVLGKKGPRWTGEARFVPEMLGAPLKWRTGRRVFVNSMSDLFHDDLTFEQIAAVFGVMAATPQHTYQVLTKRPERMLHWFEWIAGKAMPRHAVHEYARQIIGGAMNIKAAKVEGAWPLPNVQLMVSCEDQQRANERIPLLLACPAVVHGVSAEPLLGLINFREIATGGGWINAFERGLSWVIVGGESGPGARACEYEWLFSIVKQCAGAGCACFVKQLGSKPIGVSWWNPNGLSDRKGGDMSEWPPELQVRQYPVADDLAYWDRRCEEGSADA